MAAPEDWAISDAGKITIIMPQTRLRHSWYRFRPSAQIAYASLTCGMGSAYWLS